MNELEAIDRVAAEADLGELIRDGDRVGLRFVRIYPHPPERVWRALTESDQLRSWLPCDIVGERRAGAPITLPFWPGHVEKYAIDEPTLSGEISVWEPPHRFDWTWGGDALRWDLRAVDGGTELIFTTWPEDPDLEGVVSTAGGYHLCLALLATLLDDGTAPPMTEVDTVAFRLEEAYKQRFGLT
ncbi:MAG TPA: SRPBCC domain-containing protein [Microlunatus sp.]|nr:SRPBCC domain-containing protein [Microlunatus sp.]